MRRARATLLASLAAALALAAAPRAALAAARCRIERWDSLAFPAYNPFSGAPSDQTVTMSYSCTSTPGPTITLDGGQHYAGGRALLRTGGADRLAYEVYVDANHTIPFTTSYVYDATAAVKQTVVLYGRIAASQLVSAGGYADQLVITIWF